VPARRLGYRLAYRILQVVWLITRPSQTGVKCLLSHGGRILLVRHTYGDQRWDLPGGMVKRGEPPEATARREMGEELGVDASDWVVLGRMEGSMDHRRDTIHLFTAELTDDAVTIDEGELHVAQWFEPGGLPAPLRPLGAQILRHTLARLGEAGSH
jgi:8-oxo-dGTP pyrophosphatase MutT (NUDIX family)